jgi:hypothetical protein
MSDKRYKEQDPIPYDLPTPYLPKELDFVSAGDKPKTTTEAKEYWFNHDAPLELPPAVLDGGAVLDGAVLDGIVCFRQEIKHNALEPAPVPKALREELIEGAKEDDASDEMKRLLNVAMSRMAADTLYDCPTCMHETGEGRIKQDCNDCNDTGAVNFDKRKELVEHKIPPNMFIDSPPEELKSAIADDIRYVLQNSLILTKGYTEESKKKVANLLRDMLVEIREELRNETKSKRRKR